MAAGGELERVRVGSGPAETVGTGGIPGQRPAVGPPAGGPVGKVVYFGTVEAGFVDGQGHVYPFVGVFGTAVGQEEHAVLRKRVPLVAHVYGEAYLFVEAGDGLASQGVYRFDLEGEICTAAASRNNPASGSGAGPMLQCTLSAVHSQKTVSRVAAGSRETPFSNVNTRVVLVRSW